MDIILEKSIPVALGASLGFLFGLVALLLKEKNELRNRAMLLRSASIFCAHHLSSVLNMPPENQQSGLFSMYANYLDCVIFYPAMKDPLDQLIDIHIAWSKGLYKQDGTRSQSVSTDIDNLARLKGDFEKFSPRIVW